MTTPVSDFIVHLQSMDEGCLTPDIHCYERATAGVLDAAEDQALLERYRRALANACAWIETEDGNTGERLQPAKTLLELVERLLHAAPGSVDLDVQALAAMVEDKRHAAEVLRALLNRPRSPKDLLAALRLTPPQLHRVLQWSLAAGMVERTGLGRSVVYAISRLGETALRGIDEPAWLQTAAMLLRVALEARLRGRPLERVRAEVMELSGLTEPEADRTLAALTSALDPAASSALAAALGGAFSHTRVRLEAELVSGGKATVLVACALERAGLSESALEWWDGRRQPHDRRLRDYALERPVVSIGTLRKETLGAELVSAFGDLLSFGDHTLCLRTRRNHQPEVWHRRFNVDYGVVARFYAPSTGRSHFLAGGLGSHGTTAACQVFYENIESFLDQTPEDSFAAIVRVHPQGDGRPELLSSPKRLTTLDPYAQLNPGRPRRISSSGKMAPAASPSAVERPSNERSRSLPWSTVEASGVESSNYGDPMSRELPIAAERRRRQELD